MPFLHRQLLGEGGADSAGNWSYALSGSPAFATDPVAVGSYSADLTAGPDEFNSNSYISYTQNIDYNYTQVWAAKQWTIEWWQYVPTPPLPEYNPSSGAIIVCPFLTAQINGQVPATGPDYWMSFIVTVPGASGYPYQRWTYETRAAFPEFATGRWYNIAATFSGNTVKIYMQDIGTISHVFSSGMPFDPWYNLVLNYNLTSGSAKVYADQVRISNISRPITIGTRTQYTVDSNTYFLANFEGVWNSITTSLPTA